MPHPLFSVLLYELQQLPPLGFGTCHLLVSCQPCYRYAGQGLHSDRAFTRHAKQTGQARGCECHTFCLGDAREPQQLAPLCLCIGVFCVCCQPCHCYAVQGLHTHGCEDHAQAAHDKATFPASRCPANSKLLIPVQRVYFSGPGLSLCASTPASWQLK